MPTPVKLTHSLPEQIAKVLAQRIIDGTVPAGGRIIEQEIAAEFGVSRGPVREALRILEREGLIVVTARRGAQVSKLSIDEVKDLFDIRAALAKLVMARATGHFDDALGAELEDRLAELERLAPSAGKADEFFNRYHDLNLHISRAAGNPRLAQMVETLSLQARRYSRLGLASKERRLISVRHWREVIDRMRAGDAAGAADLTGRGIEASCQEAIRLLGKTVTTKDDQPKGK
jgi:DNA-binding GntR family transcriptional regulator